jgi:hypothetical protein
MEGEAVRIALNSQEAIDALNVQDGYVHSFADCGALVGADWELSSVVEAIMKADRVEIGGDACRSMGHGIVVFPKGAKMHSELLFFAHREEVLATYDQAKAEVGS